MKLLGPYNTQLQAFQYQQLLALYQQAIATGAFAGGTTFNETQINTLIQQSLDFTSLPTATAGDVVTDDSLNYPLNLLIARYNALVAESNSFDAKALALISVLQKDTGLLDILLAGADLQSWVAQQISLEPAQKFSWDFGMGNGVSSEVIDKIDPLNNVEYLSNCPVNTYLDVTDGTAYDGLVAPSTSTSYPPQDMIWTWTKMTPGEQAEALYGDGWTELDLLEDRPIINFLPNPAVNVELPIGGTINGIFNIGGVTTTGSVPIYVQISFVGRRNTIQLIPQNACLNPGFESGSTSWTFGGGWTVASDGNAHSGTNYAAKSPLSVWSSVTSYVTGNAVNYLGYDYVALANNTNSLPDLPQSTNWALGGILQSSPFPLSALNNVYIECWLKNLNANGIVTVSLVCLDSLGHTLSPPISLPNISSAEDYIEFSSILQALGTNVATGVIQVSVFGQTTGVWAFDDVRIHLPQNLSPYVVNQDDVAVYIPLPNSPIPQSVFFSNEDFVIDDISNVTFMGLADGITFTVRFTENYPAYQCSVNESVWSPVIMLDPNRPYPDNETQFNPIQLTVDTTDNLTLFPITDEIGVPTGLTLEMIGRPLFPYYFEVTTPASPQYGATAVLEIDLTRPTYMDQLTLSPFSTYPMRLVKVETQSFEEDTRQTIGAPNSLVDRPTVLTFPTTLLSKIFLTFYQESYDLSEYVVQPPDYIRRNALFAIQAVLPFNVRREQRAIPVYYRGAEYIFGLEDVAGTTNVPTLPGIFVAGPQHFIGCPDIFRYDADFIDENSISQFDTYLCWIAYNSSDIVVHQESTGIHIHPGTCQVWPFPSVSILNRSTVDHVDIFLKFVIRNQDVVIERYLLQVIGV